MVARIDKGVLGVGVGDLGILHWRINADLYLDFWSKAHYVFNRE